MSFDDFLQNRGAAEGQTLVHSEQQLPVFAIPTDAEATEMRSAAARLAAEIGRKFDAEIAPHNQAIMGLFAEMQRYWTAPVPWGSLPTPPPAALYIQLAGALQHARTVQGSYEADANILKRAGAPEFKAYLELMIADTQAAQQQLGTANMAPIAGSSANYGAPPGPDPVWGGGMMPPPGMMTGAPLPFAPSPAAPASGGFDAGAALRQQQADFAAAQEQHRQQVASFDRANAAFNDYLKS